MLQLAVLGSPIFSCQQAVNLWPLAVTQLRAGAVSGITSYCCLDIKTWLPGILLESLEPKEAKSSILLDSSLPKEDYFRAVRTKIATDSSESAASLNQLTHTTLRTNCVRLS